jgi:hypothetical protein
MSAVPVQMTGHCLITDGDNRVHLNQTNSIHHANMSRIIGRALAHEPNCGIYRIAFGNGGTYYTHEKALVYKTVKPLVADNSKKWQDTLYNEIYSEFVESGTIYDVMTTDSTTSGCGCVRIDHDRIAQVVITCKLGDELADQLPTDNSFEPTDYIFDEIGLFTEGVKNGVENKPCDPALEQERMLTHLIFSPVLKSKNRVFNIKYTLTIYIPKSIGFDLSIIDPPDKTTPTINIGKITETTITLFGLVGDSLLSNDSLMYVYVGEKQYTPVVDKHCNWVLDIDILPTGTHSAHVVRVNPDGNGYYSNTITIDLTAYVMTPTAASFESTPNSPILLSGTLGGSPNNYGFVLTFNGSTITDNIKFAKNAWSYTAISPTSIGTYEIKVTLDTITYGIGALAVIPKTT